MALGSDIRAGAAFVELKSKDSGFVRGLNKAERRLKSFGAAATRVGAKLIAGSGGLIAPLALATKLFSKYGDAAAKMSARTGLSTEAVSELGFAAEQSGASMEILEKGIRTMQRSIVDAERGLSTQNDALDAMGLSIDQLIDKSPEQQFEIIAQAISKMEDPTRKAAAAAQFFGRSGVQLLPLLSGGAAGMRELREEARSLGLTIGGEAAARAAELTDTMNIGMRVVKDLAFEVGNALAPSIIKATRGVTGFLVGAADWVKNNQEIVRTVAAVAVGALALGGAIVGIGLAATVAGIAIGGLSSLIGALGAGVGILGGVLAAVLSPIGLITVGVGSLAAIILTKTGAISSAGRSLKAVFDSVWAGVSGVLVGIKDALGSGDIDLASKILMKSLEITWTAGINKLRNLWIDFESFVFRSLLKIGDSVIPIQTEIVRQALDHRADQNRAGIGGTSGLRDELAALIAQAAGLSGPGAGPRIGGFNGPEDFAASIGSVGGRSSRGVFASAAIQSLSGSPIEKKIETNTKKTAEQIEELVRKARTGGLVFQ